MRLRNRSVLAALASASASSLAKSRGFCLGFALRAVIVSVVDIEIFPLSVCRIPPVAVCFSMGRLHDTSARVYLNRNVLYLGH
jgi:hypothetical protein